jgi:hypothetical protein
MVFEQETYIGGSKPLSVGASTSAPNAHIFKRDGAGGSFEGGLRGRNSSGGADTGEYGRGTYPDGGDRCQRVTMHRWWPR